MRHTGPHAALVHDGSWQSDGDMNGHVQLAPNGTSQSCKKSLTTRVQHQLNGLMVDIQQDRFNKGTMMVQAFLVC